MTQHRQSENMFVASDEGDAKERSTRHGALRIIEKSENNKNQYTLIMETDDHTGRFPYNLSLMDSLR